MNELISVIVPVYNAEKYLSRCIESILSQTYTHLEILLINDGSTDNSAQIMEYYLKIDDRVLVINQNNKGVSEARNVGVFAAKGKYICFVDADDTISSTMCQELLNALRETGSDIAITNWCVVKEGSHRLNTNHKQTKKYLSMNIEELWEKVYCEGQGWLLYSACNKLIKAELARNVCFEENVMNGEDIWYSYQVLSSASKVVSVSEPLYNYHIRSGSASHGGVLGEKRIHGAEVHRRIALDMKVKGYALSHYVYAKYLDFVLCEINSKKDDVVYQSMLKKIFKRQAVEILKCKAISLKLKIAYLIRCMKW